MSQCTVTPHDNHCPMCLSVNNTCWFSLSFISAVLILPSPVFTQKLARRSSIMSAVWRHVHLWTLSFQDINSMPVHLLLPDSLTTAIATCLPVCIPAPLPNCTQRTHIHCTLCELDHFHSPYTVFGTVSRCRISPSAHEMVNFLTFALIQLNLISQVSLPPAQYRMECTYLIHLGTCSVSHSNIGGVHWSSRHCMCTCILCDCASRELSPVCTMYMYIGQPAQPIL